MTASSPWIEGMIETRKSMVRPLTRRRKRPSWGTRFSAMSSSDMTLRRLMMVSLCLLSRGSIGGVEHPVDPVLDQHLAVLGLHVDVRGAAVDGAEDERVDEADDGALGGERLEVDVLLVLVHELEPQALARLLEEELAAAVALEEGGHAVGGGDHRLDRPLEEELELVHPGRLVEGRRRRGRSAPPRRPPGTQE